MTSGALRGVSDKSVRQLLQRAQEQGCTLTRTNGGHVRVNTPNGPYFMSSSPSDYRSIRALRAGLRRRGVDV